MLGGLALGSKRQLLAFFLLLLLLLSLGAALSFRGGGLLRNLVETLGSLLGGTAVVQVVRGIVIRHSLDLLLITELLVSLLHALSDVARRSRVSI